MTVQRLPWNGTNRVTPGRALRSDARHGVTSAGRGLRIDAVLLWSR